MQTSSSFRTNRNLFSNHYLDDRLPETEKWKEVSDEELRAAYEGIKDLWGREKATAPNRTESQLEERFIRPTFRKLDIPFEVEESVSRLQRRPDYGFFETETAARGAFGRREEGGDFYRNAVAVADAKRWARPLDTRGSSEHERCFENPSYRIHAYLQETPARWAVLTNGKKWRLYYGPTSRRLDSYYEVDLPTVLETGDIEDFKYFYLFFRHEAFLEDAGGDSFLDDVYDGSNVFARKLGEDLEDNVYEAIKVIAEGFLQYPDNDVNEGDLDLVYDSSLIYLYRIIFVLFAEADGRHPLETDNETYERSYSLNSLKREVAEELRSANPKYREWQNDLWSRLDELFELIDRGSKSREISGDDLSIPAYTGRLFRTSPDEGASPEAQFLAEHQVGDAHLAEVIDLLTRSRNGGEGEKTFVDYASLDVRHLGSIYEGLLELDIADEPLALKDGAYVSAGEGGDAVVGEGDVYLTTDGGERKATGSYYTPEHVVEYIVENTLEPLVTEIREDLMAGSDRGGRDFAAKFADRVLDLKILDPAMGSGYFLTSVVDYLAREIIDAQEEQAAWQGLDTVNREHDINWARRQVARHCIYGVELNPHAVEVAKVSLWLRTFAADRPFATLDYHLKTGNSLLGSDIEKIDELDSESDGNDTPTDFGVAGEDTIEQLMRIYKEFIAIENRELAATEEMKTEYDEFERNERRRRLEAVANVRTAENFGLDGLPSDAYERMAAAIEDDEQWDRITRTQWFIDAQQWADADRYFHWKLEFPEVYYDEDGGELYTGGFDAVVGNPPWVATAGRAGISANIDTDLRSYLETEFCATENQFDLYVAFYERSIRQSRNGRVGIIVPDAILTREQNEPIREFILSHTSLSEIVRVGAAFEGVETGAVILVSGGDGDQIQCTDATSVTKLRSLAYNSIPSRVFEKQEAKRFLIHLDEETRSILSKVENHPPLEEYIDISRGEEVSKRADFLSETTRTSTRRIAPGSAVIRYGIDDDELRYIEPSDVEKNERNYEGPKLIFRQTSDSLIGTYDPNDLVTIKSAYNIHDRSGSVEQLKHILGVLNSSVLDFYHRYKHAAYRSVFPQINQSTFEAFPIALTEEPDPEIVTSVEKRLNLTAERERIDLEIADYLGNYEFGPSLGELPEYQPAEGIFTTKLTSTKSERPNLKIGAVYVDDDRGSVALSATARYKPGDEATETDRWGYAETDPIPALEFVGLNDERKVLLNTFVPHLVEKGGGFAGFRENATTSKSLHDRLKAIRMPRIGDVREGLQRFVDGRKRVRELESEIRELDRTIEERVCSLYSLTDEERNVVER